MYGVEIIKQVRAPFDVPYFTYQHTLEKLLGLVK